MEVEEDPEVLMKMPRAHQLFTNAIIRIDRGNFINLTNYKIKSILIYRLVIYAVNDMLAEGLNPFKTSVRQYALEHFEEYVQRVVYKAKHDQRYKNTDVLEEKLLSLKERFNRFEFARVYDKLELLVIKINRKRGYKGHLIMYLSFTKFGLEIKSLIDKGYVF